ISAGYLNDPELTAQKFKKDPANPQLTLFHTSDLGRWNPAGHLEHFGRKDFIVKIRGYRVQLEVVEAALTNIPGIRDAAAAAYQPEGGGKRLVAYLTPGQADRPTVGAIRRALAANLADYMIPSIFIWLDELPRTAAGKADRNQLPPPSGVRPDTGIAYVAPRTALEEQIAAVWKESLHLEQVGVEDNFFELGGDSLLALDMAVKVERLADRPLPLGFFENPTIARLTDLLASGSPDLGWSRRRGWNGAGKWSRENRTWREAVDRQYSRRDLSRILGWAVGAWVMRKSYADGIRWLSWWVRQSFAKSLYRADLDLFTRFVDSIEGHKNIEPDVWNANLFGNLTAGMRFPGADWDLTAHYMDRLRRSPYRYWRDLAAVIEESSPEEFDRYFEYRGAEHADRARQGGRGVIIVSYHSLGSHASIEGLARRLGVEDIPTISQNQDRETAPQEQVTTRDSARFARTALQAQRLLEQGRIVQIVSDADYGQDGRYRAVLAGREYNLKLGFADLAVNTGARVVPKFSMQRADGKIVSALQAPFEEGAGDREERTLRLVQRYIDFINSSWREFPESLRWSRIVRHFRQPVAAGG
ncbi:MAG: phosphopantetheine-binding protein, partial [Chloroflexota bacterium]